MPSVTLVPPLSDEFGDMLAVSCADRAEYEVLQSTAAFSHHRALADRLATAGVDDDAIELDGFCWACHEPSLFHVNRRAMFQAQPTAVNWREGLHCARCGMSNRIRSMCWFTDQVMEGRSRPGVYATEHGTAFNDWLSARYGDGAIGSAYLGRDIEPGTTIDGTRHEDVERLSFADDTFDLAVCMDVLEHVNEPARAIEQIARILRPDGELLLSIPFMAHASGNVRRAEMGDTEIVHHEPAAYHGNPPPGVGWLVFWDFGWEFFEQLRRAFGSVELVRFQSRQYAHIGPNLSIFRCRRPRRKDAYASTHTLEAVEIVLANHRVVPALRKDLSPEGVIPAARGTRPAQLVAPGREIAMYERMLVGSGLAPICYGAMSNDQSGEYWLLLERLDGVELWQVGDIKLWEAVARWLARAHASLAQHRHVDGVPLLHYDRQYYEQWFGRAVGFAPARQRSAIRALSVYHAAVVEKLLTLSPTVIHGDFYPSNVLVCSDSAKVCVRAVDWELAGLGPSLIDLAALCIGWPDVERRRLVRAYAHAAGLSYGDALLSNVDRCEFHLCFQWLGWASDWTPPAEHARDWLTRAIELSAQLS